MARSQFRIRRTPAALKLALTRLLPLESDQFLLQFQLDPEPHGHFLPGQANQTQHIGSPGSPQVDHDSGMLGRDLSPTEHPSLETRILNELSGVMPRRTLEDAAGRRVLPRLALSSPSQDIFANEKERFLATGGKAEGGAGNIGFPNAKRPAVGKFHFILFQHLETAHSIQALDFHQVIGYLRSEGARVHSQSAAQGPWYSRKALQPRQPPSQACPDELIQHQTRPCAHASLLKGEPLEPAEMDGHPRETPIADQQVGAASQHKTGQALFHQVGVETTQILQVGGTGQ